MKQMKLVMAGVAMALAVGGLQAAPASKFAAHVATAGSNLHLLHSGVAEAVVSGVPVTADNTDTILKATIKTANKKDLLVGVSLQSGLYTDTTVKGKNGSSEQAGAEAGIEVQVKVWDAAGNPVPAYPNKVIFASRVQELNATLGGVIQSCTVNLVDTNGDGTVDAGEFVVARDCVVTEEEIRLMLSTTSANHFNFVVPNVSSGDHRVEVEAKALSSAEFTNGTYCPDLRDPDTGICPVDEISTADNAAKAWALVDVGSLTVEEVRAINQDGGIVIDENAGCYDDTGAYVCN